MDNNMEYTSVNGTFTYTITNNTAYVFEPIDYVIIKSAFDRWDNIMTLDARLGPGYTITVSYTVDVLEAGMLGGASIQTIVYIGSQTFGNVFPLTAYLTMNSSYLYGMKNDVRSDGKTSYYYVLLHEIGHILGIGSLWGYAGTPKVNYIDNGITKSYYTGANALREYKSYFSDMGSSSFIGIPIEDNGGGGTAGVHPEEGPEGGVSANNRYINGIFHPGLDTELMSGWLDSSPVSTPLSRITLGFLEDMGYIVNYNLADLYIMSWPATTDANNLDKAYIQGFLDVSGTTTIRGETTVKKRLFVDSDVSINGFLRALYPTESIPASAIIGGVGSNTFAGDVFMDSKLTVTKDVSMNTRLSVGGDVSMNSKLTVVGAVTVGSLYANGAVTSTSLYANGAITTTSSIVATGEIRTISSVYAGGLTATGASTMGSLTTTADVSMNTKLRVGGDVSMGSTGTRVDICGNLYAVYPLNSIPQSAIIGGVGSNNFTADVSMNAKLSVGGDVSMNTKLFVGGDVSMNTKLSLGGDVSMNTKLFVGGDVSMNTKLSVGGDVSMNSKLFVGGAVTVNSLRSVTAVTSNTLHANSTITTDSSIQAAGQIGATSLNISGAATASSLYAAGASTIGILTISGATTASSLTVNGVSTLNGLTVGRGSGNQTNNTAVGTDALKIMSSGNRNTAIGYNTITNTSAANDITAIGSNALESTVAGQNTAVGSGSLKANSSGDNNTAIGYNTITTNVSGFRNTAIGSQALQNGSGSDNVAIGMQSLFINTGSKNIGIGSYAGANITSGTENTLLGHLADVASAGGGFTKSTAIGANAKITASNQITLGTVTEAVNVPGSTLLVGDVSMNGNLQVFKHVTINPITVSNTVKGIQNTGEYLKFTIPTSISALKYFCTVHSSMIKDFTLAAYSASETDKTYYVTVVAGAADPYYYFSATSGGAALNTPTTALTLYRGNTYTFIKADTNTAHPFSVGDSFNVTTGIKLESTGTGSGGTLSTYTNPYPLHVNGMVNIENNLNVARTLTVSGTIRQW